MAHLSTILRSICSAACLADLSLAAVLSALYWLAMAVVRWNRVAMPSRFVLRAQIASVETELETLQATTPPGVAPWPPPNRAAVLLTAARELIDGPRWVSGNPLLNYLFWSRGQEITGWGYTYEAQKQMVPLLPEPTVRARLEGAADQLELADDLPSRALSSVAKVTLAALPAPPLERLRALLSQALAASYDREYNTYADLVSWQNKVSWLVGCGLLLIVVLTSAFPDQSILFLVGATGGLLSRLSRSLDRKDAPTDYGASWTTLFLSPVAGALGAWVGILIAALAVKLQILDKALGVGWGDAHEPMTLAVAVAFGFSERLLDSVFDKLDAKVAPQAAQSTPSTKPPLGIVDPGTIPGHVGLVASAQLQVTGAAGSVTWTLVQPAPATCAITPGGSLSWGPLPAGNVSVSVQAADSATHVTAVRQLTLHIA